MPRRKDKQPSTMVNTGMRIPTELLDTLTTTADCKGVSRNALIIQILTKATRTKTLKSRSEV